MSVAWGCLAVVGVFVARYFKHTSWWIFVHVILLLVTSLITIISTSLTYKQDGFPQSTLDEDTLQHQRMGMILASVVISQGLFGFIASFYRVFTRNLQATMIIARMHRVTGWALLVVGVTNCVKGWDLYGDGSVTVFIAFAVVVAGGYFCFDLFQRVVRNNRKGENMNLPEITHEEAVKRINEGEMLMFADDLVINVGKFITSHPGGSYLIAESVGEDAGKYMSGCSSYGGKLQPYTHSSKALAMTKLLAVAKIPYPDGYIISQDSESYWIDAILKSKFRLNEHTYMFCLKSDRHKLSGKVISPAWLGKHFQFKFQKGRHIIKRYYSTLFTDLFQWGEEIGITEMEHGIIEDGIFRFIVKIYEGGAMTRFLYNLKVGEVVGIRGPLGPGLLLDELKGKFLALAGGTGLVPFLDLVYMTWKRNFNMHMNFKLVLFVFFSKTKDEFALEILKKVESLAVENWLKVESIVDNSENKKNVPELIKARLKEEITKAWVCGPSGFNRHYADLLLENGLAKEKLVIM
jgi:NAD(P)H-flavin reductase